MKLLKHGMPERDKQPLRVLVTFPFSIYPIVSGGALRGYYLLRELSRHFDTFALVCDAKSEIEQSIASELGSDIVGLKVEQLQISTNSSGMKNKILNRVRMFNASHSIRTPANSTILATTSAIRKAIRQSKPDVAILTDLDSWVCSRLLGRISPTTLRILDLPNVEHVLRARHLELQGKKHEQDKTYRRLRSREKALFNDADSFFACSNTDTEVISLLNSKRLPGCTVPNGVDCEKSSFDTNPDKNKAKSILFCGSLSYPPNIDGLNWFAKEVWPSVYSRHPDTKLLVVGRDFRKERFVDNLDLPGVDIVGEVADLRPWYHRSGVVVCPLRVGSGTRLKILEAMGYGNPVVSTTVGCEGINAHDNESILIRNSPAEFSNGINELLSNPEIFDGIRRSARRLAEERYDWRVIGETTARQILSWHCNRFSG